MVARTPPITAEEALVALNALGLPATANSANALVSRMESVKITADGPRNAAVLAAVRFRHDMDQFNALLREQIRPMPRAKWQADYGFSSVERGLQSFAEDYGLNLVPDYQRGHVWTQEQQEHFVEAVLRGTLASSLLVIQFNAPHWEEYDYQGDLPRQVECVDGLQRLSAVRRFMNEEIRAFGRLASEYEGSEYDPQRRNFGLKFAVHTFQSRAELLQFYLDINKGGTPHTAAELDRVAGLLAVAKGSSPSSNPQADSGAPSLG